MQRSLLVALAALLLAAPSSALRSRADDQASDAASSSLFGPENNEELLAERDDLQQQLALKNSEFLAQHKRADMLEVEVHTLQATLMGLQQKVAAVQAVFQANLAGVKLPAFSAVPPTPAKTEAKQVQTVHMAQHQAQRRAPPAAHRRAQHRPKPRAVRRAPPQPTAPPAELPAELPAEPAMEQPVEQPVEQPAVLAAAPPPPQPVARKAEQRPAARPAAPAAKAPVDQADATIASIESDLASDDMTQTVAAAEIDGPLAPEVKREAPAVAPVATVSVAEAPKVAKAAPVAAEAAPAATPAPVAAVAVAPPHAGGDANSKDEESFQDMEAELKAEDSKIDSLDTHDEGGSTLALEGTTQLADATPAAPVAAPAPVKRVQQKKKAPVAQPAAPAPVAQQAAGDAKDDGSMSEYENDAALLEKLVNGNS